MKKINKIAALVLALMLVFSMSATAFAADEKGSITIEDAVVGQTYTVYQILDLESYNADLGAYSYKAAADWKAFVESEGIKDVYLATDAQGYVTWVENADAAALAKLAQAYAKTNTISPSADAITATATTIKFEGLDLGYYLVDTTLGTICSLDTTNPDVTMEEKNEVPSVTKEVQEDSTNEWGATNDADINQVVNYKATVTVQKGAENYVLHDKMSAGLTFNNDIAVTVDGTAVAAENYTVSTTCADGCTFEVAFKNEYIAALAAGKQIVVTYSAVLNEEAVVGLPGNPNDVKLQYGDSAQPTYTPWSETVTYTWDMNIVKFTKDGETEKLLAGAVFKLCADEAGATVLKFHALGENKYELCAKADCDSEHVTEITTDATGAFSIEGVDADTYYLHEVAAPAGYNKLPKAVTVIITGATEKTTDDGAVTLEYNTIETKVENKAGAVLPSTGGMGTTIFYIVGGILVVAAIVLLVVKKRMNSASEAE